MIEDYEEFSESQVKTLQRYVTNVRSNIFVLQNLPEVIKGALFSRYSRSSLGLRSLLLKEFINNNEEAAFASIAGEVEESAQQVDAIKKAQNFYDRILDGYGDDSIGELGGAHLAIENISMLATKIIEDCRIGGSPLEKSTRYIYFDQKFKGEYLFYREPILMTSAYRDLYLDTCNMLFDTYSKLIPPMTAWMQERVPKDPATSVGAYTAAIRAKVLDCLRGLLPAGTLTNMGIFGNGRFFESSLHKLHCSNLEELQNIGKKAFEELAKVVPSFVRRADVSHKTHQSYVHFVEAMQTDLRLMAERHTENIPRHTEAGVRLMAHEADGPARVAAALLFACSDKGLPELQDYCRKLPEEELARILDAACNAREMRRHKSPRALEHATFTFEIIADYGIYRDLHRHRILTQERQLLSCDYGFHLPKELVDTPMELEYCQAMSKAKKAFDSIAAELPEEAQYVVPMGYNIRWYFHVNLRSLQWLCELRSSPAGHPQYCYIAQTMAKEICRAVPAFERFFRFVDYEGHELGRLGQEMRKAEKLLKNG